MLELSLNIMDIAQNSIRAEAKNISVRVEYGGDILSITVSDDGTGMDAETLKNVTDPFFTTRTTRAVGLGIPFFKMAAEMTGGEFHIDSVKGEGTTTAAKFIYSHIDRVPLGNLAESMGQLICLNETVDITFTFKADGEEFTASTGDFTTVLDGVPLGAPEVMQFVCGYIQDNMDGVKPDIY
jgi:signal transduction histidine kinase